MKRPQSQLRSVCIVPSREGPAKITTPGDVDLSTRQLLRDTLHSGLEKTCPASTWSGSCHIAGCPYPLLIDKKHQLELVNLNKALVKAIDDIIGRWWKDVNAKFPERMPLQPVEERLLRWLDSQGTDTIPPFRERCGSWRPDFLVEENPDLGDGGAESFRICEINARFCWNGSMMIALGQDSMLDMGICCNEIRGEINSQKVLEGLQRLYSPKYPLHLLKGREYGFDIHLYTHYASKYLGQHVRFITPTDLRLIPCHQSRGGYKLCCLADTPNSLDASEGSMFLRNEAGEYLEEIHQVGLELHQNEILALSYEMLREISLRCFNDMRTLLLVHDKRMLGIVLEELDSLMARDILTPSEAGRLQQGICHTVIPGSTQMAQFIQQCRLQPHLKDNYLLKPVRGGKGEGIIFGENSTDDLWMSRLSQLTSPCFSLEGTTYVIQRKVRQAKYEVLLKETIGVQRLPIVGTYHAVHGEFLGLGVWRSSPGQICAISHGGAWMCSVMQAGL